MSTMERPIPSVGIDHSNVVAESIAGETVNDNRTYNYFGLSATPELRANQDVPWLLPYLPDRRAQQLSLTERMKNRLSEKCHRPLLAVIVASDDQCVETFASKLQFEIFPKLLEQHHYARDVQFITLQWQNLEAETREKIVAAAPQRGFGQTSQLVHLGISIDDWSAGARDVVRRWPQWWRQLDLTNAMAPSLVLITVEHGGGVLHRLRDFFALKSLRRDIAAIVQSAPDDEDWHLLPELSNVKYDDVKEWIRERVKNHDQEKLRQCIRRHFSNFLFRQRTRSLRYTADLIIASLTSASVSLEDI